MINKDVKYLILSIQEVETKDKEKLDVLFGKLVLKGKENDVINFTSALSENKQFEGHINRIIQEAIILKEDEQQAALSKNNKDSTEGSKATTSKRKRTKKSSK